jgi:hypothetical protein
MKSIGLVPNRRAITKLHFPNRLDSVSSLFIPELRFRTDKGDVVCTHYLIAAAGNLSATDVPPFKRPRLIQGKVVSHQPLAARRRRLRRQAGRRDRHQSAGHIACGRLYRSFVEGRTPIRCLKQRIVEILPLCRSASASASAYAI